MSWWQRGCGCAVGFLIVAVGCGVKNPIYCDEETPCMDPLRPCPGTCEAPFPVGTEVRLIASDGDQASFLGFSGDCAGYACGMVVDGSKSVVAEFGARAAYKFATAFPTFRSLSPNILDSAIDALGNVVVAGHFHFDAVAADAIGNLVVGGNCAGADFGGGDVPGGLFVVKYGP